MTTKYQQIPPATILKTCKNEREGHFPISQQMTFLHTLLLTASHPLLWEDENLYLIQITNPWKMEKKSCYKIWNYCMLWVQFCIKQFIAEFTKVLPKKKQNPKVYLDLKCYFPGKWCLCLLVRYTFSASLAHKLFVICSLKFVFITCLYIICPYIPNRYRHR